MSDNNSLRRRAEEGVVKHIRIYLTGAAVLGVAAPATLLAHHHAVNFLDETVAFFGEVTRVDWANPHVYIYVETGGEDGETVEWGTETSATPRIPAMSYPR